MDNKHLIWLMPLIAIVSILIWHGLVIAPSDNQISQLLDSLFVLIEEYNNQVDELIGIANDCVEKLIICENNDR